MNRHPGGDWTEALDYHTRCLQLLIPVLSGGQDGYTEAILAAVAVLRLNEEMDGKYPQNQVVTSSLPVQCTTTASI